MLGKNVKPKLPHSISKENLDNKKQQSIEQKIQILFLIEN